MSDLPKVYSCATDEIVPVTQGWCDEQVEANSNQFRHREVMRKVSALNIRDDMKLIKKLWAVLGAHHK